MTIEEKIDSLVEGGNKTYYDSNRDSYVKKVLEKTIFISRETMDDWPDNLSDNQNKLRNDKFKNFVSKGFKEKESEIIVRTENIN